MANRKPEKTLADYVGIAISPVLIMVLVGSLAFFLLEVIRVSPHLSALRWTMFWYVIAIVLIGRIGIEQGNTQAMGYGVAIGLVTSLVILKYAGVHFFGCVVIMGLIWWCAHKLTWDCTMIDESEDASGEGLLQVAGIEQKEQSSEERAAAEHPSELQPPPQQEESTASDVATLSLVEQIRADRERHESLWNEDAKTKKKSKPHAPGLWIIYFSLAALPLFGLGQIMIDGDDTARRSLAFRYLWFYVAAALALLLTTSFLGLRRYLRQRNMAMPSLVVKHWLGMGGVMILVIMVVALLLPRPNAAYSITGMIDDLGEKVQKASDYAFLKDDAGKSKNQKEGKGKSEQNSDNKQSLGKQSKKAKGGDKKDGQKPDRKSKQQNDNQQQNGNRQNQQGKSNKKSQGKNKQEKKTEGGQKKDRNRKGENKQRQGENNKQGDDRRNSDKQRKNEQNKKQKAENRADRGKQNEDDQAQEQRKAGENRDEERDREEKQKSNERQQERQQSQQPQDRESEQPKSKPWNFDIADWVGDIFKWILYAIISIVILYYLIKNWERVVAFFRQLWQELMNLFHRNPPEKEEETEEETVFIEAPPPFASFRDPFSTKFASGMHPSQVVIYTFDALESWAYEYDDARQKDETPLEFADRLESRWPSAVWNKFARLYTRTVYSQQKPNEQCYDLLRKVWHEMSARQSTHSHPLEV